MRNKAVLIVIGVVIISVFMIVSKTYGSNEKDVLNDIQKNKAIVTNEARAIESYSKEEIDQCPELQNIFNEISNYDTSSIARNNIAIVYGDLYTSTVVTSYGDNIIYSSLPRLVYTVSDVGTAGSTNIDCKFEVIEYVCVNGEIDSSWESAIKYKNIFGEITCGDNTAFTSSVELSGATAFDTRSLVQVIFGMDEFYNAIRSSDSNSVYNSVYRVDMEKEELYEDNHYLNIMSSISTIDSNKTENQLTMAVSKWGFDVYLYKDLITSESDDVILTCEIEYIVNLK